MAASGAADDQLSTRPLPFQFVDEALAAFRSSW